MTQNDWTNLLFSMPVPANVRKPNGINFDNIWFTEPISFECFPPPFGGGLYAILIPDITARPRTYREIYFGQAEDLSERVCKSHEKYRDWAKQAGGADRLYVAFHAMTGTERERVALEERLIDMYKPACNDKGNALADLYKRLLRV